MTAGQAVRTSPTTRSTSGPTNAAAARPRDPRSGLAAIIARAAARSSGVPTENAAINPAPTNPPAAPTRITGPSRTPRATAMPPATASALMSATNAAKNTTRPLIPVDCSVIRRPNGSGVSRRDGWPVPVGRADRARLAAAEQESAWESRRMGGARQNHGIQASTSSDTPVGRESALTRGPDPGFGAPHAIIAAYGKRPRDPDRPAHRLLLRRA